MDKAKLFYELKKHGNFFLISIDAPQKTRFERLVERGNDSDPKTWDEFLILDKRDFGENDPFGQQVGKCMELADFKIRSDGLIEELNRKIEEIWDRIKALQ